jgi:glycosyltransferase involved in cell wall biosynthesis
VKYANASAWPESMRLLQEAAGGAANIELSGGVIDDAAMGAMYDTADALISLHCSEGLGLVVAEAMIRGLPVIATDWSGTTDFLDEETGVPIGYRLVPVADPQGTYRVTTAMWAEPDVSQAAAALLRLRADPALRARLGQAAAARMRQTFHPARFAERVCALIGQAGAGS